MKRRSRGAAACLWAGLWCATAHAADSSPGGLRGLQHVWSADTAGRGVLSAGVDLAAHVLEDTAGSRHDYLISELHFGVGVGRELELGAAVPVRAWRATGLTASRIEPASLVGFGDLVVAGKLRLPLGSQTLRLGLVCEGSFPTGSQLRGMSSGATDVEFGGLATLDLSELDRLPPTRIHFNVTRRWNRNETEGVGLASLADPASGGFWPPAYPAVPPGGEPRYNDALRWQGALEFTAAHLSLFTEFVYERFWHLDGTHWRDHPVWITEGARLSLSHGVQVSGAVDVSLQEDTPPATLPRLPEWRFHLGVTCSRAFGLGDGDGDGIPDQRDACPRTAEDVDGFADTDGCPDLDNDGDGIADQADLAPDVAEDRDGFQDEDGRPDLDNDADGIRDPDDGCPNDPEDYDGDSDIDGCPDLAPAPPSSPPPAPPAPSPPPSPPGR